MGYLPVICVVEVTSGVFAAHVWFIWFVLKAVQQTPLPTKQMDFIHLWCKAKQTNHMIVWQWLFYFGKCSKAKLK